MATPTSTPTASTGPEIELNTAEVDYSGITNDSFQSSATPAKEEPAKEAEEKETPEPAAVSKVIPNPADSEEEEEVEEKEEPAAKEKTPAPAPQKETAATKRKFEGLDEDDAEVLKKAPNHVFNHFSKKLKETIYPLREKVAALEKELEHSNVEKDYLNPEGFEISPQYKALNNVHENLETELDYWRDQAKRVEAGKPTRYLTADTADMTKVMSYKTGAEIPKEEARSHIMEQITAAKARLEQVAANREQYKQHYVQQNQTFVEHAKKAASQYFPYLDNPAPEIKEKMDAIRMQLGPLSRGLGGEMQVRTLCVLQQALEQNKKLQAEIAKSKKTISSVARADPLRHGAAERETSTVANAEDLYAGVSNDDFMIR